MNAKKIIGIILTVFGTFFLFIALIFVISFLGIGGVMNRSVTKTQEELEEFIEDGAMVTTGTVISDESSTTIEYYVPEENTYYTVDYSVTSSEYSAGTSVDVYYDTDNPSECMVPGLSDEVFGLLGGIFSVVGGVVGFVFGFLGIVLVVIGIILLRKKDLQITG